MSSLERASRAVGGNGIVPDLLRVGSVGLGGLKNVAGIGVAGGQGLSALGSGDWEGALRAGTKVANELGQQAVLGADLVKTAGPTVAQTAPLFL